MDPVKPNSTIPEAEQEEETDKALQELATKTLPGGINSPSWDRAVRIVSLIRPVPSPIWQMVRAAFGPYPLNKHIAHVPFLALDYLLLRAAQAWNRPLSLPKTAPLSEGKRRELVTDLSLELSAALVFIHAVCCRSAQRLRRGVWRPIVDDALFRAELGMILGSLSPDLGVGAGVLAGFSARAGLALQLASNESTLAESALEKLASGVSMHQVGLSLYGCDPVEVAAMCLVAGGCRQEIGRGVAAFVGGNTDNTMERRWLAAFRVLEYMRMGRGNLVKKEEWELLGLGHIERAKLIKSVDTLLKQGPSWHWIMEPPHGLEPED